MAEAPWFAVAAWLAPPLVPLLFVPLLALRTQAIAPAALSPVAGMLVALLAPDGGAQIPWLFLGASFGLDDTGRTFLFFTASLWLAAGVHAVGYLRGDPRRRSFWMFWCAAMAGNFGLILAQDAASFYVFFALMSFASYGLVVHIRAGEAFRAGRVYIALVIVGELALFSAIALAWWIAGSLQFTRIIPAVAASPLRDAVIALALSGFGIKLGVVPLHVWLPLAHPVAPTPASAVLSGAMVKAGLLGWLKLLPLDGAAPAWGALLLALGLAGVFAGALAGVLQKNAKAALAYSTVSQMGYIAASVSFALAAPGAARAAVAAATMLAFHHAFAKASLFLSVSMVGAPKGFPRALWWIGFGLPALALAGAPGTSGLAAKLALKSAWPQQAADLGFVLGLGGAATTLLMVRVLWLLRAESAAHAHPPSWSMWLGWAALVCGCAAAWLWFGPLAHLLPATPAQWISAVWPLGLGGALAAAAAAVARAMPGRRGYSLPPGDLFVAVEAIAQEVRRPKAGLRAVPSHPRREPAARVPDWPFLARLETLAMRASALGLVLVAAALAMLLALAN